MATIHNNNYYYNIARKNIKKYRLEKKYTQQQLAEEAHMSLDYLSEIESIKREKSFSIDILGRIADVLEVPIEKFFERDN